MGDYMGKKVNMFLLMMVMLVIVGMGALSIYYQMTFKGVNSGFVNVSSTLEACQVQLSNTNSQLQTTLSNLNSTETDIRKYDTLYEQKNKELETKKDELASTQQKLNSETIFKEQFKRQAESATAVTKILNQTVKNLNTKINDLENQKSDLEDRVYCLRQTVDTSETSVCLS